MRFSFYSSCCPWCVFSGYLAHRVRVRYIYWQVTYFFLNDNENLPYFPFNVSFSEPFSIRLKDIHSLPKALSVKHNEKSSRSADNTGIPSKWHINSNINILLWTALSISATNCNKISHPQTLLKSHKHKTGF